MSDIASIAREFHDLSAEIEAAHMALKDATGLYARLTALYDEYRAVVRNA